MITGAEVPPSIGDTVHHPRAHYRGLIQSTVTYESKVAWLVSWTEKRVGWLYVPTTGPVSRVTFPEQLVLVSDPATHRVWELRP